ncbi:MAG: zinc ribbon domain-containing protein [Lachnospiraceae bacterium]|nr:zinc ribbon domain-containing protein [Lachnospiraceae bacterium]
MKCPNCGANIGIRDEFCAWCGKPNDRASRHVQILKKYREKTDETKADIETQTLKRVPLFIRLLVIALLLAGFVILIIVVEHSWDWENQREQEQALRRAPEYTVVLDQYIRDRDHLAFRRFMNRHSISVYGHYGDDSYPYRKYRGYERVNDGFFLIVADVLYLYPYRSDSYQDEDNYVTRIADNVNSFYSAYERGLSDEDDPLSPEARAAAEDLEAQTRALLVAYLGVSEQDAAGIRTLTEAQRKLLIESAWSARKGGA